MKPVTLLCVPLPGSWRIERLRSPGPDRVDDHVHLIGAGDHSAVCSIAQPGERSDAEADAFAALLAAAQDMRVALVAARRALERADAIPCRAWVLSVTDAALMKANGGVRG
jgi:hypothetical protein